MHFENIHHQAIIKCKQKGVDMKRVGIVGGLRTYIGVEGGMYRNVSAEQLGAHVLRQIPARYAIPVKDIDMVIAGNGVGGGGNVARLALLEAGYPQEISGITVDVQCGSGLEAIAMAAAKIEAGLADVIVAGGMESASTKPGRVHNERHPDYCAEHPEYSVAKFAPGKQDELAMLKGAERVGEKLAADNNVLAQYVITSHQRAAQAAEYGLLDDVLADPYCGSDEEDLQNARSRDEGIRPKMSERLLQRLPALVPGGKYVTAGTVSLTNDGAAFVALCSAEYANAHGLSWEARLVDVVSAGADPDYSPESMVPAIRKLLERNALTAERITAWEYNEAFAVIDEIMVRSFGEHSDRYNIYGGALAYGHPYGASGAIITLHLLQALRQLHVPEVISGTGMESAYSALGKKMPHNTVDQRQLEKTERNSKYGIAAVSAAGGIGTAMLLECNEELHTRKEEGKQVAGCGMGEQVDKKLLGVESAGYWNMLCEQPEAHIMLVEDDQVTTYGQMVEQAAQMRQQIQGEGSDKGNNSAKSTKRLYLVREHSITEVLIAFFACQDTSYVPVIVPEDMSDEDYMLLEQTPVPEQAAMGVLTSGTTGRQKIMFRTFESWADFFPIQNEIFSIGNDTVLFAQGSLAFTGNLNLYMGLFAMGGTIVATKRFQPHYWMQLILQRKVNAIYLIPAKMMALCRVVEQPVHGILHFTTGSQSFGQRELAKVKKAFPDMHVVLYYGASEVSYITYLSEEEITEDASLVGHLFPNVKAVIREGAFYVESAYGVVGVRMPHNTGDLGRMDEQGNFYFLGRADAILNINGRKVSAYRIEQTFAEVYHVVGIAKVGMKGMHQQLEFDYEGEEELPGMTQLRGRLRAVLQAYEIPKICRRVEKLPRTESGKIKRCE